MAAAVLTRTTNDSPLSQSKMSSPKDTKRSILAKNEGKPEQAEEVKPVNTTTAPTSNAQPLAPPPRPTQNGNEGPDYFSHNPNSNQFSLEPNPFEQSFGNPSSETPGKSILPPVASITSPSPLQGITPGWSSLRSGPLSPAMLTGPQNTTDYFGESFRGGFPTPNESSLRTGLTPGGGGSMFPAPSPNSQALFNLQSGGATPAGPTSQPPEQAAASQITSAPQPAQQLQRPPQDLFSNAHDVNTAANDLLQFSSGARNGQFAVPNQPPNHVNTSMPPQSQIPQENSPTARRNTKGSIGTSVSGSVEPADHSESGNSEEAKPSNRTRGKKTPNNKTQNNRRKAEETPAKAPANKKQKGNNGAITADEDEDSEDENNFKQEGKDSNGKKMTDEEKRKNFLERNRVAALKCRQRKKQWLANLQAKVELFSTENDALSAQVTQLREEVVNLKTLLLAHKDCPVSQAQGLGGMAMSTFIGEINHHANPYGMAMQPNGMGIPMPAQPGQLQRT